MKRTLEATVLALAVCASVLGGFSRGRRVPATTPSVAAHFSAPSPAGLVANAIDGLKPVATQDQGAAPDFPDLDHSRVDYWIKRYTTDLRSSFAIFLGRMPKYEPMIESKLEERGMPKDLIFLAFIESGFNPAAKSPAAAKGMWQFIAATAERYGLTVTRHTDDRTDPEKSTEAALSYLSDLYDRFGAWYLAAAAYNTGEGRIARLMTQVTGSEKGSESDYYAIWNRLPAETRDYVPKMVAAARIAWEPEKYGFDVASLEGKGI